MIFFRIMHLNTNINTRVHILQIQGREKKNDKEYYLFANNNNDVFDSA